MRIAEANRWASRMPEGKGKEGGEATGSDRIFQDILKACTTSVVDPGPAYAEWSWEKALIADRFQALLQIRALTYPDVPYSFNVQCENCDKAFIASVNLARGGDLEYRDIPPEARTIYRTSNRFEVTVGKGENEHKFVYKLASGEDEARIRRLVKDNRDHLVSASLGGRILEMDGITEPMEIMSALENLDLQSYLELKTHMEDNDGGVETDITARCPHCSHANFNTPLPFGKTFILPDSYRRSR